MTGSDAMRARVTMQLATGRPTTCSGSGRPKRRRMVLCVSCSFSVTLNLRHSLGSRAEGAACACAAVACRGGLEMRLEQGHQGKLKAREFSHEIPWPRGPKAH